MIAALLLLAALAAADAPMTDEEVVRRVAAGESTETLLADIKKRPPAFDVSEEMLTELRKARVPETLIAEMIARAATQTPEPPPARAPVPMAEVRLVPEGETFGFSRRLDPQFVANMNLRAGALEADELALAVLCTAPEHDDPNALRWPEGRLPRNLPKGRLLAFFPTTEAGRAGRTLRVTLGSVVTVPVTADEAHDLAIAVVLRAGGDWVVLGGDDLHGARASAGSFMTASLDVNRQGPTVRVSVRRPTDAKLPELPRSDGWAKGGSFAVQGIRADGQVLSPDGRKRVIVGKEGARLEIDGQPARALSPAGPGDTEVLWSPDSRVVSLTGGSATASSVALWRIEADLGVHPLPIPDEVKGAKALSAAGFAADGSRLLLVARDEGRLTGYLVKTADGSLAARFTELEIRARWQDRLGPRLR